jgi:xanthine dehydrogenase molybdopterin-binding subunit B
MTTAIGESLPRPDALGKVTGTAGYPGDLVRSGMLQLKVVFAERPHARILALDTSAALAHPGVVAVLTAADVPYNAFGLIDHDQPVLCGEKVRFVGDKVALVVAMRRWFMRRAAAMCYSVCPSARAILHKALPTPMWCSKASFIPRGKSTHSSNPKPAWPGLMRRAGW